MGDCTTNIASDSRTRLCDLLRDVLGFFRCSVLVALGFICCFFLLRTRNNSRGRGLVGLFLGRTFSGCMVFLTKVVFNVVK